MSASKVDLLRLVLPPSHAYGGTAIRCAWRLPGGQWHSALFDDLGAIATRYQARRLEICPHPSDVSVTEADLPPLPPKRLRLAVRGVVELLALLPPDELAIAFGPRSGAGKVPVAWMSAQCLAQALHALQQHGLRADAVLPPPAFLPSPDSGDPGHAATAIVIDDWVVMRTGPNDGALHPLPMQCSAAEQLALRLQPLLPPAGQIQWLCETGVADKADPAPWSGAGWGWTLPQAHSGTPSSGLAGLRPALAWGAAALAVWLTGLNLHALRVAAEGQALKQQMAAQVKAAFPELPIVLDPLQQARQLRDARKAGTASTATPDFSTLLRASTALLTQSAGQVQRVDYRDGQVEIRWRDGAMLRAAELEALQGKAGERGLVLESDATAVRLRVNAEKSGKSKTRPSPEPAS